MGVARISITHKYRGIGETLEFEHTSVRSGFTKKNTENGQFSTVVAKGTSKTMGLGDLSTVYGMYLRFVSHSCSTGGNSALYAGLSGQLMSVTNSGFLHKLNTGDFIHLSPKSGRPMHILAGSGNHAVKYEFVAFGI